MIRESRLQTVDVKNAVKMVGLMLEYYGCKASDSVPDNRGFLIPMLSFCGKVRIFYDYLGRPWYLL